MPLNFLGPSIVLLEDENLILCPGDTFGDLNNTYFVVKDCSLEMYHQDRRICSTRYGDCEQNEDYAFLFEQDGDLEFVYLTPSQLSETEHFKWFPWTKKEILKTELRIQNQEFQILQTLKDGSQRLFAFSEKHPYLREYIGKPKKIGSSGFVKSHADNDTAILSSHEYIGDLDGLHLVLKYNCQLRLKNSNRTIWFIKLFWLRSKNCSLVIQEEKWISLSQIRDFPISFTTLMITHSFKVLESQFLLKDDQLFIIQTLEDGSQLTFESQLGKNKGLKLQKQQRQIAQNNFTLTNEDSFTIDRMDYIGNLTGLHLILQDNCTLMLLDGKNKLWQWKNNSEYLYMDCSITFFSQKTAEFFLMSGPTEANSHANFYIYAKHSSRQQLILDNNYIMYQIDYENENRSEKYYAGPNTHKGWFRRLSERSFMIKTQDKNALSFPKRAFLGDLTGVYLTFEDNCNWVLYNKSQVLWESGTSQSEEMECDLLFQTDGTFIISYLKIIEDKQFVCGCSIDIYSDDDDDEDDNIDINVGADCELPPVNYESGELWSTKNTTQNTKTSKKLSASELLIDNDWLWLTKTYQDGTVQKFKAQEGTNNFVGVEVVSEIDL